jgi:hypothetical protein
MLALIPQGIVDVLLLTSLWVLTTRRILAMQLLIAGQAILLVYLVSIHQLGFWPWNLGMVIVAARNWRAWSRVDHAV